LNSRCRGIKRDGEPCSLSANGPDGYCWAHSPRHAEERRRMASRAGKSKPSQELTGIKQRLWDLADDVLEGRQDKAVATAATQVLNVYLRAISIEMKQKEQLELVGRLEALEEGLEQNKRRSRTWRA
jgi:hypothetical protein